MGSKGEKGEAAQISALGDFLGTSCQRVEATSKGAKVSASCTAGQKILTGGGRCIGKNNPQLITNYPVGATSWAVECSKAKASVSIVCCSSSAP